MTAPVTGTLAFNRLLGPSLVPRPDRDGGGFFTVKDALLQSVRGGNNQATAAAWAGIAESTLSTWIDHGLTIWAKHIDNAPGPLADTDDLYANVPEDDRPFAEIAMEFRRGRAVARMRMVGAVVKAAETEWRAAKSWLEAEDRGTWAPAAKVEVNASVGQYGRVSVMSHADAAELKGVLEARRAAALGVGEVREATG